VSETVIPKSKDIGGYCGATARCIESWLSILQEFLQRRCLQPLCDRYCVIDSLFFCNDFLMWLDKDINPSIEKYLLRQ
jgi:hypothetical protein